MTTILFFLNDPAPTEIYTLSYTTLFRSPGEGFPKIRQETCETGGPGQAGMEKAQEVELGHTDRKSTRLNSSHLGISYAVFCLKKKNKKYPLSYRYKDKRHHVISEICVEY